MRLPTLFFFKRDLFYLYFLLVPLVLIGFFWLPGLLHQGERNWKFATLHEIVANPAVNKNFRHLIFDQTNVYFGNADGYVYAVDKRSGGKKWEFRTNQVAYHGVNATDEARVFLADFDGRVYALNKETGEELWRFSTPGLINPDTPPVLSDGLVYFGSRNGLVYALDETSGEKRWEFATKGIDNTQLKPDQIIIHLGQFSLDEDQIYINSAPDNTVYCLDKKTGEEKWRFFQHLYRFGEILVGDRVVVLGGGGGQLYVLDKKTGQLKWKRPVNFGREEVVDGIVYIKDKAGDLFALESFTGKQLWQQVDFHEFIQKWFIFDGNRMYISSVARDDTKRLRALDKNTGEEFWQVDFPGEIDNFPLIEGETVYIGSGGDLYALDKDTGSQRWRFLGVGQAKYSALTSHSVFLVNSVDNGEQALVYSVNKQTGKEQWHVKVSDIDLTGFKKRDKDEHLRSIQTNDDGLYFLSWDRTTVFSLRQESDESYVTVRKEERGSFQETEKESIFTQGMKGLFFWVKRLTTPVKAKKIEVVPGEEQVGLYKTYEITITQDETLYPNVWVNPRVVAIFTNEKGESFQLSGFYYDKNTWKVRFAPVSLGKWTWKLQLGSPLFGQKEKGEFTAVESGDPGFVRFDPQNNQRFILEKEGNLFSAIGIQDCFLDRNHNGDPLDQWAIGTADFPQKQPPIEIYSDLNAYLETYGPKGAGFNLFRWNVDNCSYPLWREIAPGNSRFDVNRGVQGDILAQNLKDHGYRIWLAVFGFEVPFVDSLEKRSSQIALQTYLDYVVARYSAYVDVWELANEAKMDEDWIRFTAEYLRSVDPYNHPITVNWERQDLPQIEINSVHWYQHEPAPHSDQYMVNQIMLARKWGKPVVFSEHGNAIANWDPDSALRMRIRSWTAFFQEAILIFWNHSSSLYENGDSSSNIYLGPKERQYVRVLQDFSSDQQADLKQAKVIVSQPGVRGYGLVSSRHFLGYFHHFQNHTTPVKTTVLFDLPKAGTVEWIRPDTGEVVAAGTIGAGSQSIAAPSFAVDLALKITLVAE